MMEPAYTYRAHCIEVYDGDTITVDIDVGFGIWLRNQKIRLYGINTPELRGEDKEHGVRVRDWVRRRILDKDVILKTHKDEKGKYGRWLGEIFLAEANLNQELKDKGYAHTY